MRTALWVLVSSRSMLTSEIRAVSRTPLSAASRSALSSMFSEMVENRITGTRIAATISAR
jgi:hypothetical protein